MIKKVFIIFVALFIFIAITSIAPIVQFKFNMFGATLVTFGDICKLWVGCIAVGFFSSIGFLAKVF